LTRFIEKLWLALCSEWGHQLIAFWFICAVGWHSYFICRRSLPLAVLLRCSDAQLLRCCLCPCATCRM